MYKQASKAFFQDKEKSSSAYSGASEAADQEKSRTPSGSLQTEEEEVGSLQGLALLTKRKLLYIL